MRLNRFITIVQESPVGEVGIHGMDTAQPGRPFGRADRAMLAGKSYPERLRNAFANTPFWFDIYIVNSDLYSNDRLNKHGMGDQEDAPPEDVETPDNADERMRDGTFLGYPGVREPERHQKWASQQGLPAIQPHPDRITVVVLSNYNPTENTVGLTPWMIAHRLGHTLFDDAPPEQEPLRTLASGLWQELKNVTQNFGRFHQLLTFRSARKNILNGSGEVPSELVAQYLIQGRVEFRRSMHSDDARLTQMEDSINAAMERFFSAARGHVIRTV